MTPTISVMVLNHDYERFLHDALTSVTTQQPGAYELAEVVVVDDGSTDGSLHVCSRFPLVRVVATAHEGFPATLTRAVREADATWLALLDADDVFLPDKLRTIAPLLTDQLHLLQHAEYVIDAEGRTFAGGTHPGGSSSSLVVRSSAARDLLPVTNEQFFHVLGDLGLGTRIPDPLIRYRVHDASMTDRRTPGTYEDYLATVCGEVAVRLDGLARRPPGWASANELALLAATYRQRSGQHRERADRQRTNR